MEAPPATGRSARRRRGLSLSLCTALVVSTVLAVGESTSSSSAGRSPPVPSSRASPTAARHSAALGSCPPPTASASSTAIVARAVSSGRDVWGERLLSTPQGPTYDGVRRYLPPLLYGQSVSQLPLTRSGVHYLAFAYPLDVRMRPVYALHVADGGEIVTRRVDAGPSLTIQVGPRGLERYGTCLARLAPARLAKGYLPILQTSYVDAAGVRYHQESFLGRVGGRRPLVSLVRLSADARFAAASSIVRFVPSRHDLVFRGDRLDTGAGTALVTGKGGAYDGGSLGFRVARGHRRVLYALWVLNPAPIPGVAPSRTTYDTMRADVVAFWARRLATGVAYLVPERRVMNAVRALLIQQVGYAWRYSAGNAYEELSFAEGTDTAEVMSRFGVDDVARNVLDVSLVRLPGRFTSWRAGERLTAEAVYFATHRDSELVDRDTPGLLRLVARLEARQLTTGPNAGRLRPERLCSDRREPVDSVTAQTIAWEGLLAMSRVWSATGHPGPASRARRLALSLGSALRPAVADALVRLPDGTLFLPEALDGHNAPYENLTQTRAGSYWNLVVPYTFATGFFAPGSADADGLIAYLLAHGSRLLGLPRSDAHSLYGDDTGRPTAGVVPVYGFAVSRFLADNDRPDQLVLTLYGLLGAGMTTNTFVAGEAVSIAPRGQDYYRTTYLPPNAGANSTFLETLRLMLVHESRGTLGAATGVDLAFSTPRGWLSDGKAIRVTGAPTSFGPVSYSIVHRGSTVTVHVVPPPRSPQFLRFRLRVRLPRGERITRVRSEGRRIEFDRRSGTVDLTGRTKPFDLVVTLTTG